MAILAILAIMAMMAILAIIFRNVGANKLLKGTQSTRVTSNTNTNRILNTNSYIEIQNILEKRYQSGKIVEIQKIQKIQIQIEKKKESGKRY